MEAEVFGKYIKGIRKDKDMTIRQLELYSGVSNSYLSQMENGKRGIPSPDILRKLSKGLKTPYVELLRKAGYIDEENENIENDEQDEKTAIMNKIANDFPNADLMFYDLAGMSAEDLQEVYEFIKFKVSQKEK